MECNKIRDLLTPYVDGELGAEKVRLVDSHVRDCSSCLSELLFLQRFKRAAAALPRLEAPDGFMDGFHARMASSPPLLRFLRALEPLRTPAGAAAAIVTAVIIAAVIFNIVDTKRPLELAQDRTAIKQNAAPVSRYGAGDKRKDTSAVRVPAYELVLYTLDKSATGEMEADDIAFRSASRGVPEKPAGVARDEMAKKAAQAEAPPVKESRVPVDARKAVRQAILAHGGVIISDSTDSMIVELPAVNLGRFTGSLRTMDAISLGPVPPAPAKTPGSMIIRLRFSSPR